MSKNLEKENKKLEKEKEKEEKKHSNNKVIKFNPIGENYLEKIQNLHLPRWNELPAVDLYLDQLITLLDTYLSPYIGESDTKIITKTMVNNYVKQGIIDAPEKKKYNKNHIASLFVITALKPVYSMNSISLLLQRATTNFKTELSYNRFCDLFEYSVKSIFQNQKLEVSTKLHKDEILLQNVIASVAYKIYVEKTFLENNC